MTNALKTNSGPKGQQPSIRRVQQWGKQGDNGEDKAGVLLKGFPASSVGKESACNVGDPSSVAGSVTPSRARNWALVYHSEMNCMRRHMC